MNFGFQMQCALKFNAHYQRKNLKNSPYVKKKKEANIDLTYL